MEERILGKDIRTQAPAPSSAGVGGAVSEPGNRSTPSQAQILADQFFGIGKKERGTPSRGIWWKLFRQQLILRVPPILHTADDHDLGHDLTKFSGLGTTETQRKAWVSGMVQTYVSLPEFMCWNPPPPKAMVLGTGASGNWWGHVGGASDSPRPCHQVTSQEEDEEPSTQQAQNCLAPACWSSQPLGTVRKC